MKLFIVNGKVTSNDESVILSAILDAEVPIGGAVYQVVDDVKNPSVSFNFPTLEMARKYFPNAEIVE